MTDVVITDEMIELFARNRAKDAIDPTQVDAYVDGLRNSQGWANVRAGLAAVAPLLRAQVCEEIAQACETARDEAPMTPGWFAYDHAAGIARLHRMPDCGDEYHGADGGPCPGCGFDVTAAPKEWDESPAPASGHPIPLGDPPNRRSGPYSGPDGQGDGNG